MGFGQVIDDGGGVAEGEECLDVDFIAAVAVAGGEFSDVPGIFDLLFAPVTAQVFADKVIARSEEAQPVGISMEYESAGAEFWADAVTVGVKVDPANAVGADGCNAAAWVWLMRQWTQERLLFMLKHLDRRATARIALIFAIKCHYLRPRLGSLSRF